MKKRRLVSAILCVAAIASSLTACGGTASSSTENSQTEQTSQTEVIEGTYSFQDSISETYTYSFEEYDLPNVETEIVYTVDLPEIEYSTAAMPTVSAEPEAITGEQAQKIAQALFDGAELYEYSRTKTKDELQSLIDYWSEAATYEYMAENEYADVPTEEEIEATIQERLAYRQEMCDHYVGLYQKVLEGDLGSETEGLDDIAEEAQYWQTISTYEYISEEIRAPYTDEVREAAIAESMEVRAEILADYEERYESANERFTRQECQWTYHPESYYRPGSTEPGEHILASAEIDGVSYTFRVHKYEPGDIESRPLYREYSVEAWISDPTYTMTTETELLKSGGFITNILPDEKTLEDARLDAAAMIAGMGIGEWQIVSCEAEYTDRYEGYVINIIAQPAYEGVLMPYLGELIAGGSVGIQNYVQEGITLTMSANGRLIEFRYDSPLKATDVQYGETGIITYDELTATVMEGAAAAVEHKLEMREDSVPEGMSADEAQITYDSTPVSIDISLSDMEIGLVRVNADGEVVSQDGLDETEQYYLVPAAVLSGRTVMENTNGDIETAPWGLPWGDGGTRTRLIISLVDGEIMFLGSIS